MEFVNNSIYLKKPSFEELYLTEKLLSCQKTMSFNNCWGGTIKFGKEKQAMFFEKYCTGNKDYEYYHIYNLDHVFIGEIGSKYNNMYNGVNLNIKIKYEYQGNHHASDALTLFLDYIFIEKEMKCVIDNVAFDNTKAISFLESFGFIEVKKSTDAVLLKLNRNDWV